MRRKEMHSNEDREKIRHALESANTFMAFASHYFFSMGQTIIPKRKYSFANGTWSQDLSNKNNYYQDGKIFISASPDYDGSPWSINEIAVIRGTLFWRKQEPVYRTGTRRYGGVIIRPGLWIGYVQGLAQWAKEQIAERAEKRKMEEMRRKEEIERRDRANNIPIDDSSIFGK
jgi:hypothetical protein